MKRTRETRRHGFTLIEGLVAGLILSVALAAMFRLWAVCYTRIQSSGEITQAGQLARAELERAKVFGALLFPTGAYSSVTGCGTWSGSFDPTANSGAGSWVSGHIEYFDIAGNRVASSGAAGVRFSLSVSTIDSGVLTGSGSSYTIDLRSRRALLVTVRRQPENSVLFTVGSNLVVGGL